MNEISLREAERAAFAQRIQLEALQGALRVLETRVGALESQSARQSVEISCLDERIARLHAESGVVRPDPHVPPATGVASRPSSSAPETRGIRQGSTDPSSNFTPPDVGENWEAYLRNVEQYIADHGIETTQDPLAQLLPLHRAVAIRRGFDEEFRPARWDRWDYGIVALAVLLGTVTDYLLVATPGGTFKGCPQRGSPLTAWMKEQSKKLAPIADRDDIERNAFQQWIAKLANDAEKWSKVPFDVVRPKLGLTPNVHRLASLGHDPLLGLVFGTVDIFRGNYTFIDKSGAWQIRDNPNHKDKRPLHALVKVVVHGFSDVFTEKGLPPPFLAPFQSVGANSGITLKEGGDPVSVRDVARYMYSNGYDLRHFATMTISPATAEIILMAYHGVRACATSTQPGKAGIPERLKRKQMLALTHVLLASANVLKTALYGWNPMAINLAQFQTLARRMLSLLKFAAERDRLLRQRLNEGWQALVADARPFLAESALRARHDSRAGSHGDTDGTGFPVAGKESV